MGIKEQNALFVAVKSGSLSDVCEALKHGVNVNSANENGASVMHRAAKRGDIDIVKALLKHKPDLSLTLPQNNATALHIAAREGHIEVVVSLVQYGASASVLDNEERTPLAISAEKSHTDVVKFLLENVTDTAELVAIMTNEQISSHEVKQLIVQKIKSIDPEIDVSMFFKGSVDAVKDSRWDEFLSHKNENVREAARALANNDISTAVENLTVLLEHMPNDNIWQAARSGSIKNVQSWLERGVDINARQKLEKGIYNTPLCFGITSGNISLVEYLLQNGADINDMDSEGNTPLHYAAVSGEMEMVQLFFDKVDINSKNNAGKTPLAVTTIDHNPKGNQVSMASYLISMGADVDIADNSNHTPLLSAVMNNMMDVAKVLALLNNG